MDWFDTRVLTHHTLNCVFVRVFIGKQRLVSIFRGEIPVCVFVDVHIPQEQGICYILLFVFLLGELVVFVCVFADVHIPQEQGLQTFSPV